MILILKAEVWLATTHTHRDFAFQVIRLNHYRFKQHFQLQQQERHGSAGVTLNLICDVPGSQTCGSYLIWCKQSVHLTKTQGFNWLPCMFFSPISSQAKMTTMRSVGRRSCPRVLITSCISSLYSGRFCSPSSRPQSIGMAGPAL